MGSMRGKVALVTGASRGIGMETAFQLADKGPGLYLAAEGTPAELEAVAAECDRRNPEGGGARFGIFDLCVIGAAEAMVAAALEAMGRIDVLVNNAAIRCRKPCGEYTKEDYDAVMTANLRLTVLRLPGGASGHASGGGRADHQRRQPTRPFGQAEHLALRAFPRPAWPISPRPWPWNSRRRGISVNTVSPGPIETRYSTDRLAEKPEVRQDMVDRVPQGRFGTPEEVAEVIVFLASSDGDYIQGHNILVDGGELTQ